MKLIITNNTNSVNKTVIENDEILETERENSSPNSNLEQKTKLKQNFEKEKENRIDRRLYGEWYL